MRKIKNLEIAYPNLLMEWHPTKNGDLKLSNFSKGSSQKIWWKCKEGHVWESSIVNRCKPRGCPKCRVQEQSTKFISAEHDIFFLKNLNPEFYEEFDITKNKNIKKEKITIGDKRKFWWLCSKCGFSWLSKISARRRRGHTNCKICMYKLKEKNILSFNEDYVGKIVDKNKSFGFIYPELAKEWHTEKNGYATPFDFGVLSNIKVWWKCKNNHEWETKISNRTKTVARNQKSHCPECKGRVLKEYNTLAKINERVSLEWDYSRNEGLSPNNIKYNSNKLIWWKCKFKHEWQTKVYHRTINNSNCPRCSMASSLPEIRIYSELSKLVNNVRHRFILDKLTEIDIYLPNYNLALEYDGVYYHKNNYERDLSKNKLLKSKNIKLIRIREEGLPLTDENDVIVSKKIFSKIEFNKVIKKIVSLQIETKIFTQYLDHENFINEELYRKIQYFLPAPPYQESLLVNYPEIAKEFDLEKNSPLTPELFRPKSGKKVWWRCQKGHSWQAVIANRTFKKSGCPKLGCKKTERKESKYSIFYSYPELMKEWDYEKNKNLNPKSIRPFSKQACWWKCIICNNSFQKAIWLRTKRNIKCKICFGKIQQKESKNSILYIYPEIAREWNYKKNGYVNILTIKPNTKSVYWWTCTKCNKDFQSSVVRRTQRNLGCSECF
jgi:hypothetical protein